MSTVTQQLAELCAGLRFASLPSEVIDRTKQLLLDYLGVCYGGARVASSAAALKASATLAGGEGSASVVGGSQPSHLSAPWAALANGTAAHALEMDDVTSKSSLHPGVAVFPAALAVAEELGSSAEALLAAVVAGYEVTMRLGNALNPASAYEQGFHPTGVAGAFGATAATASLLGLDPGRFTNALGIAGTMASGSLEYLSNGAWTKRLNAGWAAHCGVVAGRLAAEDFTGPDTAIEGDLGFLHAYSQRPFPSEATKDLGDVYQVMKVSIKPYACCRYNHGLIDCMLQLRSSAGSPEDVEEVRLGVLSGGYLLVADPIDQKRQPRNVVDAQFSAPFAAAAALVYGKAGQGEYTQAALENPLIRSLMARTSCYKDPELDSVYPDHWPAAASLQLRSGKVLEARQPYPLGEPENPVTPAALAAKFSELVAAPWADEAIRRIYALPNGSVASVLELFRS